MAVAEPAFRRLGEALGPGGRLLHVPGNHDHAVVAPWLTARGRRTAPPPLTLHETPPKSASELSARLAKAIEQTGAMYELAYPGAWLREDVYAHHGHYIDRLTTLPSFERLALGAMARAVGRVPEQNATPDDFEAALAPVYAWMRSLAEARGEHWQRGGSDSSANAWTLLAGHARPTLKGLAARAAFPLAVGAVNAAGLGPVDARVSGPHLRRASLRAISDVVLRLGVDAEHVLFGHTHRSGPLPGDPAHEWQAATGAHLHNCGAWTTERAFLRGGDETSPYYAGRAIELRAREPPALVRVTRDLG